jgi:hypothetical protein
VLVIAAEYTLRETPAAARPGSRGAARNATGDRDVEVREAIGSRRTYRYLLPHGPVEPAPLPWRQQELKYLQNALDLPDF